MQEYVAYDRIGVKVAGAEGEKVDQDNIVIMERFIRGGHAPDKCWRVLQIFPASEINSWRGDQIGPDISDQEWARMKKTATGATPSVRTK